MVRALPRFTARASASLYARTSFLYAMRCGRWAPGPFRRLSSSMYAW